MDKKKGRFFGLKFFYIAIERWVEDVPTKSVFFPLPISHAPTVVNPPGVTFLQVKINTHLLAILKGKGGEEPHMFVRSISRYSYCSTRQRIKNISFLKSFLEMQVLFGITMFHHLMII